MHGLQASMSNVDTRSFNVLSLCSGGAGLDLGVKLAVPRARTVCYVEIEAYACEVLASRMETQQLDEAPIWTDLRSFYGAEWRGVVDCVIGGYPCQPFSVAGKRRGADDPRHLWPAIVDILLDTQPAVCFFENVGHHLRLGFHDVACDLLGMGYRVAAGLFTAEEVGLPHKCERLFIMAHRECADWGALDHACRNGGAVGLPQRAEGADWVGERGEVVGDSCCTGLAQRQLTEDGCRDVWQEGPTVGPPSPGDVCAWDLVLSSRPDLAPATSINEEIAFAGATTESEVRRVVDELANRMDRLRLCGNGVVPAQAAFAWRTLWNDLRNS